MEEGNRILAEKTKKTYAFQNSLGSILGLLGAGCEQQWSANALHTEDEDSQNLLLPVPFVALGAIFAMRGRLVAVVVAKGWSTWC